MKTAWKLLKETAREWYQDNAPRLGASLAYYTLFSLSPLLIILVAVAGWIFGEDAARKAIVEQFYYVTGVEGAKAIEGIIESARRPGAGLIATITGMLLLLFGASAMFAELQGALNTIWNTNSRRGHVIGRLFSFALVLATGFLLLVSLAVSAAVTAAASYFEPRLPVPGAVLQLWNAAISIAVITVLFALIYKVVPEIEINWADVWMGALFTALLFNAGKSLIGLYLGRSGVTNAFGAAGSVVLLVAWVYYSAQIFFFGAEFTQVYARWRGSRRTQDAGPSVAATTAPAIPGP